MATDETPQRAPLTEQQRILTAASMYAAYMVIADDQLGWLKEKAGEVEVPAERIAELLQVEVDVVEAAFTNLEEQGLMHPQEPRA